MGKVTIRFDQLRQLLFDLGFEEAVVPKEFVGFRHDPSDTEIFLPIYRGNQAVAPHHLAMFRVQLDGKGILEADEFDRRIASAALKHSAS
jgi:hypothetical protein